jgi:hypothetical protein
MHAAVRAGECRLDPLKHVQNSSLPLARHSTAHHSVLAHLVEAWRRIAEAAAAAAAVCCNLIQNVHESYGICRIVCDVSVRIYEGWWHLLLRLLLFWHACKGPLVCCLVCRAHCYCQVGGQGRHLCALLLLLLLLLWLLRLWLL